MNSLIATAAELFVNPAGDETGDYRLRAAAAAINRGIAQFGTNQFAPSVDLDGLPRPVGAALDIGAYEWRPQILTGDYNNDGVVSAADYVVWRNTLGTTVAPFSGADGDGNGIIGDGDYTLWQAKFGVTAAARSNLATVPEPAPTQWLATALAFITPRRRLAAA
jgi:hypothetical protein